VVTFSLVRRAPRREDVADDGRRSWIDTKRGMLEEAGTAIGDCRVGQELDQAIGFRGDVDDLGDEILLALIKLAVRLRGDMGRSAGLAVNVDAVAVALQHPSAILQKHVERHVRPMGIEIDRLAGVVPAARAGDRRVNVFPSSMT
jgi:hypothetical protein